MRVMLTRLRTIEITEQPEAQVDEIASSSDNALSGDIDRVAVKSLDLLMTESEALEKHTQWLQERYSELEAQSKSWSKEHDLAQKEVADSEAMVEKITTELNPLKGMWSPIWKVPTEIWKDIFEALLVSNSSHYVGRVRNHNPFRTISLMGPAAVCRLWRDIIIGEPGLWTAIYIHPSRYIPKNTHEVLSTIVERGREPLKFVTNLSRSIPDSWNEVQESRSPSPQSNTDQPQSPGDITAHISPDSNLQKNEVRISGSYQACLILDDSEICVKNASLLPYREADELEVYLTAYGKCHGLPEILRGFSGIRELFLSCSGFQVELLQDLRTILPSLSVLILELGTITDFDFEPLINLNLTDLRIYHNGATGIPRLRNRPLRLASLETLGISYPSYSFLGSLETPNLETIRLRGPGRSRPYTDYGPSGKAILQTIKHLRLICWDELERDMAAKRDDGTREAHDVAAVFARLTTDLHALQTVSFINCDLRGSILIEALTSRLQSTEPILPKLETVTISKCKFITRAECEEIQTLIPRLVVYV
ncbi:hypothetical protein CPB86DRAFT_314289 [Serendipita vermifera]|nr:hypothetical protein CPB86DRAFT_314289 [Serendipita vermifera]